jgi:hypothetical protein
MSWTKEDSHVTFLEVQIKLIEMWDEAKDPVWAANFLIKSIEYAILDMSQKMPCDDCEHKDDEAHDCFERCPY